MMQQTSKKVDTYSYKGWLNSDNFLKRAFAAYGYMMVASVIIIIPIYALMFVGMMFFGILLAATGATS